MADAPHPDVQAIELVEDRTPTARCDEGFLRLRRLTVQNLRTDGSRSRAYPVDVIDRDRLDAVAVVLFRRVSGQVEVLLRDCLRPAAWFRRDADPQVPDPRAYLTVPEIVAGVLEREDRGEAGLRTRSAAEALEEAGYVVAPEEVEILGAPFFVAPGILSEKIFLTCADMGDRPQNLPPGDGSPLEEGGRTRWWPLDAAIEACVRGEVEDAKTEIGLRRLQDRLRAGDGLRRQGA